MKVTYNWLKEYVDLAWDWRELVDRLTMSGLALEGVEELGTQYQGVVIGHVLECHPHPAADHLAVCQVDLGRAVHTIVCGAPNVAAGQKVAVALPGTRLPSGLEVRKTQIRGVESAGMICAEDELGLSEDHSGIAVLSPDLIPGQPFAPQFGLDDVVLDFEVTPNRPDCLSVLGIAREIRALTGAELRIPPHAVAESGRPTATSIAIAIETPEDCPRYVGRVIRGVRVGPSPAWLQRRLRAVGLRPINNVVDATNYVLMELGQPLHAFDLRWLAEARIAVRRARPGESLCTLDGVRRELTEEVLVIADGQQAVAVAGIMGGANSEVSEATTDILLESAYFDPRRVRRGRSLLQMQTEASMRFERGVDWAMTPVAADRAARLIAELAGGQVAPEPIDLFPNPPKVPCIRARVSRVNQLLATHLEIPAIARSLSLLGCQVEPNGDELRVIPPTYRPDLQREADLIEEVGRLYGYDRIEGSQKSRAPWLKPLDRHSSLGRRLRQRLIGLGFDEVMSNTIVENRWLTQIGDEPLAVRLANPPTETQGVLRTSLIPSLLEVACRNLNQRLPSVAIFELGKCFRQLAGKRYPQEYLLLSGLLTGRRSASPWKADHREVDFLDLKGALEALLDHPGLRFVPADHPCLRPGWSARLELGHFPCGYAGEVRSSLCASFDIKRPVYIFELEFEALVERGWGQARVFSPLPKFPPIERDLAVVLPVEVNSDQVSEEIRAAAPSLIEVVELFDLYQGDQIPAGHKSLAFSIRLRSPDRTLADEQADAVIGEILKRLEARFGAVQRGAAGSQLQSN